MDTTKGRVMIGTSHVDENQHESVDYADVVSENPHKTMISGSLDELEMLDASSSSSDDASDTDDSSTDLDDLLGDMLSDMDDFRNNHKISYKILSLPEIQHYQELDIIHVSNSLSIQEAEAIALLVHCNWNVKLVTERWDEDSVGFREELGLFEKIAGNEPETTMTCKKCSGTVPGCVGCIAFCGHKFCLTCWQALIGTSLKERHLLLRCPYNSCNAAVNQDVITMVASESDQKLYSNIFLRSYLSDFSKGKWCPNTGCNHGLLLDSGTYISRFTCKCLFSFCYLCDKEAHQPVSCGIAETWRLEKFAHFDGNALNRYHVCLARWNKLHDEQYQILVKLQKMQQGELQVLAEKQGLSLEEVSFVHDAWLQAAECKRVLKWASVYDYYKFAFEDDRKRLCNRLLDHGTFVLVELSKVAGELKQFIGTNPPTARFQSFCERLSFKSSVARTYFKSMEFAIQSGYSDMETLRCVFNSRQAIESKPEMDVKTTSCQITESSVETSKWTCAHCNLSNHRSTAICFMCYH